MSNIQMRLDLDRITGFDGDAGNVTQSAAQHTVSGWEAEPVFFKAPRVLAEDLQPSQAERRYHALGRTDAGRRLPITFTLRARATQIRGISARDLHRQERQLYAPA